jgi:cellobiose phosphorylase
MAAHGLPLMGTGEWNDAMNLVGAGGKDESTRAATRVSHSARGHRVTVDLQCAHH